MEQVPAAPSPGPAEPVVTPSVNPDDALRNIASEVSVEEQVKSFTATPQPQPQPLQPFAPDPVTNPEGYKAYMDAAYHAQQQAISEMRNVSSKVSQFEQMFQQQKVDAAVDLAVKTVNAKAKADPDLIEAMLNLEYTKNPSFKKIFDNRDRNPSAYEKALNVLGDKYASKFQVRQDPQIAENVRAAQASQRTMATTNKTTEQMDQLANMTDLEFQRWWQAQRQG